MKIVSVTFTYFMKVNFFYNNGAASAKVYGSHMYNLTFAIK